MKRNTSNWSNFGMLSRRAGLTASAALSCFIYPPYASTFVPSVNQFLDAKSKQRLWLLSQSLKNSQVLQYPRQTSVLLGFVSLARKDGSHSAKSGLYGGCGKASKPRLSTASKVRRAACDRALSCNRMAPHVMIVIMSCTLCLYHSYIKI